MSKTTTRIVVISAIFLAFALGMLFQESTSPRSVSGQADMDLGNGNLLNIGTSGNDWTENHILHIGERVGGGRGLRIVNSDNTNGESHARASVVTGGSSGGDPAFLMEVLGEKSWSLGLITVTMTHLLYPTVPLWGPATFSEPTHPVKSVLEAGAKLNLIHEPAPK